MKLPSSSSLLLATLAISSSSSTLAAPAGEGDAAITTSSSNQQLSALVGSSDVHDLGSADIDNEQRTVENSESKCSLVINQSLETHSGLRLVDSDIRQNSLVSAFLELLHTLPIIGHPVAALIEKSFPNGPDSVQRMPDISPDDLQALQTAIAEVSRVLNQGNQTLGASNAVQSVALTAISNGDGLNTSSVPIGFASTSAADPTNTTSVSPPSAAAADRSMTMGVATFTQTPSESASASQSSPMTPTIPGNPPNTPVPPAA